MLHFRNHCPHRCTKNFSPCMLWFNIQLKHFFKRNLWQQYWHTTQNCRNCDRGDLLATYKSSRKIAIEIWKLTIPMLNLLLTSVLWQVTQRTLDSNASQCSGGRQSEINARRANHAFQMGCFTIARPILKTKKRTHEFGDIPQQIWNNIWRREKLLSAVSFSPVHLFQVTKAYRYILAYMIHTTQLLTICCVTRAPNHTLCGKQIIKAATPSHKYHQFPAEREEQTSSLFPTKLLFQADHKINNFENSPITFLSLHVTALSSLYCS